MRYCKSLTHGVCIHDIVHSGCFDGCFSKNEKSTGWSPGRKSKLHPQGTFKEHHIVANTADGYTYQMNECDTCREYIRLHWVFMTISC